jgi:hypothetical protein
MYHQVSSSIIKSHLLFCGDFRLLGVVLLLRLPLPGSLVVAIFFKSISESLRIEYHLVSFSIVQYHSVSFRIILYHSVSASNLLRHSVRGRFIARTWEIIENCRPVEISLVILLPLLHLDCLRSIFCGHKPRCTRRHSVSYDIISYHQYHVSIMVSHLNPRPSSNSQSK